jgi:hypothetical protein
MRLTGTATELDMDLEEYDYEVVEAVVTAQRIAIDWIENGEKFHVVAVSTDGGTTYRGTFGCTDPEPGWVMEIARYTAKNKTELLLAEWLQTDIGRAGSSVFRLWAERK